MYLPIGQFVQRKLVIVAVMQFETRFDVGHTETMTFVAMLFMVTIFAVMIADRLRFMLAQSGS